MAYQVLARKWRPQRFADVVGQEHVTTTLVNAIRTGRLAHAFLFCGPRGVGKTTAARILAKCLNCERAENGPVEEPCNECAVCREIGAGTSLDVLEIDGASNRGIDEIRDLRENVRYAPAGGRAKVYIIDEVHMLTKEAFNALLKTLEEPPPGVYFVFATTEVHRVPATIRSRCQRYDFHRIDTPTVEKTLARLAKQEGFKVDGDALAELARQAEGGLRDAQSLLDQAAAVGGGKITVEDVRLLLGEAEDSVYLAIIESCAAGDTVAAFGKLQELLDRGMDPSRIALSITQTLRDLLVAGQAGDAAEGLGVRADRASEYCRIAGALSGAKLTALLALASRAVADLRRSARPRLSLEVALARMSRLEDPGELVELAARLDELLGQLGATPPEPPSGGSAPEPEPRGGGSSSAGPRPKRARSGPARGPEASAGSSPRAEAGPAAAPVEAGIEPDVAVALEEPPPPPPPEATFAERPVRPPASASGAGDSSALWDDLLSRVRGRKRMLASFLEHGAPGGLEGEIFSALFDNSYYEGMVQRRENLDVIQEELSAAVGRKLLFRARPGVVPATRKPAEAPPEQKRGRSPDLLAENPGLGRVVRDLGGQILPGGEPTGS